MSAIEQNPHTPDRPEVANVGTGAVTSGPGVGTDGSDDRAIESRSTPVTGEDHVLDRVGVTRFPSEWNRRLEHTATSKST